MARADKKHNKGRGKAKKGAGLFPKKVPYAILVLLMGLAAAALFVVMILVNLFPKDLTLIIIGTVIFLLIITSVLMARRHRALRIAGILLGALFLAIVGSVTYYLGTTYATMSQISETGNLKNAESGVSKIDVTEEAFNIYITGIDQWGSEKGEDLERSDVNMIVTVNPLTKKIMLTSIPRDSYVKLHTAQQMDKLTHTGIYGVDETVNTVEDWLDIDIDYYVKMNFSAARDVVDAIGGIDVYSPRAFESSLKGYKYEKGWNHLKGKRALYFARERKSFEGQDAIRVENQQRVLKAIIKKMTSSETILLNYGDVMKAAGKNMRTNMTNKDIQSLVKMQIRELSDWDVETQKITGSYDMDYVASLTQRQKFSIYRPSKKSEQQCKEGIDRIMNPTVDELQAAEENKRNGFIESIIERSKKGIEEKTGEKL